MSKENINDTSPSKLKEKIEHLRSELVKNQDLTSKNIRHELDPAEEGLTKITEVKDNLEVVISELEQEIDLLLKDNNRLREEKLLVLADGENLKKRIHEELGEVKRFRAFGFAEKLLPVLDNFERALEVENVSSEVKNFLTGFEMIYKLIKLTFSEEGIVEIPVKTGDEFNPQLHAAIETIESQEVKSGSIIRVLQKGYYLHGRVLRHTAVEVAK
ncbi:nucleotide exchange factor GrpE [Spiroplasma chrysopicola]|uniref:Protein GrpE n=1 Tax=Spiroplasma chrysopicola DF-1 TaxID=1276227 RepID=R4U236_9MOLU|nr:nucleotide exchange factor GrpE [Spiroplasma chrysopicola]AGM25407.1 molecular chaperone GrpE (heat shock protein) [Spiroplasma chrysopicola DF-1]